MTEVSSVKSEYARKADSLAQREREVSRLESQVQKLKADTQKHIREKAEEISRGEIYLYKGFMLGSLLYGVLCTVFTALRSEAFVSDFKTFFGTIWTFLRLVIDKLLELAKWASKLGDMIPQEIVAFIVHWLILIAVAVLIGGGVVFLLFIGASKVYSFYKDDYADQVSLAVFLVSLAVAVFFADQIRAVLPINLLLLLILTHMIYVGVRWYVKGWRASRGYY